MVTEKKKWIKTADFEAKTRELVKGIKETNHITRSGILKALDDYAKSLVETEEPTFEIIKELRI